MENINNEIEKTLQSWDTVKRFEANPFLYTRIEQQIKNLETPPKKTYWNWQPILIVVLVSLNFFTIATAFNNSENKTQSVYEVIADQYHLSNEGNENSIKLY